MYKGMIQFTIEIKESESTSVSTIYHFAINDESYVFVRKSICACVKLLELIGAKDINCDFLYIPGKR